MRAVSYTGINPIGVTKVGSRHKAQIRWIDGKIRRLGHYSTAEEGSAAYQTALAARTAERLANPRTRKELKPSATRPQREPRQPKPRAAATEASEARLQMIKDVWKRMN